MFDLINGRISLQYELIESVKSAVQPVADLAREVKDAVVDGVEDACE